MYCILTSHSRRHPNPRMKRLRHLLTNQPRGSTTGVATHLKIYNPSSMVPINTPPGHVEGFDWWSPQKSIDEITHGEETLIAIRGFCLITGRLVGWLKLWNSPDDILQNTHVSIPGLNTSANAHLESENPSSSHNPAPVSTLILGTKGPLIH